MFEALKKKLSSFFGKPEKTEIKEKKRSKSTTKTVGKLKKGKPETKKRTRRDIDEERKVSEKVLKDIKKEKGNKINSIPQIEEKETKEEEKLEAEIEEENIELEKEEINEEKPSFFSKIFSKVTKSTITLKSEQVDEIFMELELTLLENNVALEVVDKIKENLHRDLVGIEVKKNEIESTILNSLKSSILEVLIEPPNLIEQINKSLEPYVILFFGINGTGKTTSIAKLAHLLKKNKISCVLAAGDTFRAASIEQLETHAKKIGVPIVKSQYNADPASVAFDAIAYAKKHNIKAVLIDTAGRMYTKANLLKEMEKIIRVSKPNLKIFVGESITGNDATEQAKTFNETAGIDGIILSKADVDEKAGTILSVSFVTKKPIYFLGTGQSYEDLQPFRKKDVLKNLGLE